MTVNTSIRILIAEDNDVSRQMMAGILRAQNYEIIEAINGDDAIEVVRNMSIDLALVDIKMHPTGGFEFVRYMRTNNINIPVVVITGDDSSDILVEAKALNIMRLLQKPIDPDRLLKTVQRALQKQLKKSYAFTSETRKSKFSPEELVQKAIAIADSNASAGKGQPYGAIITDKEGRILGEGANGTGSRIDPTAHAEVIAIRQAAEKLGATDLSDCMIYCSSEPTMMARALIISAGIKRVYFGLSHQDVQSIRGKNKGGRLNDVIYTQICHSEAASMFQKWVDS